MKLKMTNYSKNVRVDLSDREVHVPKKEKFKVIREPVYVGNEVWNSQTNVTAYFVMASIIAVVFMFIALFGMRAEPEWPTMPLICGITFFFCLISAIAAVKRYKFHFQTIIWIFNTTLWAINFLMRI